MNINFDACVAHLLKHEGGFVALTPAKVAPLYREMYWDRIKADKLPSGVDYCVFDAAVNSGVSRAAKWLQTTVGAVADGAIGEQTLKQVLLTNPQMVIDKYSAIRLEFLKGRSTWPTFGKGWGRRVEEVKATANSFADPAGSDT